MTLSSISFNDSRIDLIGVVTHIIHTARDNRGVFAIFQIKVKRTKFVVVAEFGSMKSFPDVGDIWLVTGEHKTDNTYGSQFKAEKAHKLLPDKDTPLDVLADFLVFGAAFTGITRHYANKLVKVFGNNLYSTLEHASIDELTATKGMNLSKSIAHNLLNSWTKLADESELIEYFDAKGFPLELVETARQLFGKDAIELLNKNPYLLYPIISIKAPNRHWKELDRSIRKSFKIKKSDRRRAISFIESLLYSAYREHGHMALPIGTIIDALEESNISFSLNSINTQSDEFQTLCLNKDKSKIQILGHSAIEGTISFLLNKRVSLGETVQAFNTAEIDIVLSKSELSLERMTAQQIKAISNGLTKTLSFVDGPNNSGKKLIIQVIAEVLLNNGENLWLISSPSGDDGEYLSGIGKESVNTFINNSSKRNKADALKNSIVVVNDAHTIDALMFYKLLKCLPLSARLCFVGDHRKLPPVGPGYVFGQLISNKSELITHLKHQYGCAPDNLLTHISSSLLVKGNDEINKLPSANFTEIQDVSIYETKETSQEILSNIAANIWLEMYLNFNKSYQLICAHSALCDQINKHVQQLRFTKKNVISFTSNEKTYYEGEQVIFIRKNQYLKIQSGQMAIVYKVYDAPILLRGRECVLSIKVNHKLLDLTKDDLECLSFSYAINAYKVQSYKFENTILVLDNFYLISKSWLYTAINASRSSLIFIGDRDALNKKFNSTDFNRARYFGTPLELVG